MIKQIHYFFQDVNRMLGKNKFRIIYIWFSRAFLGILVYRFERGLFAVFGIIYPYLRIIFLPLFNLLQAYSNLDLHYNADIKGGLLVLHPSAGIVVSGYAIIGINLTLTGGNIIGSKPKCKFGDIVIGDNCELGANAVVIGPIILGNRIRIGALACVVHDFNHDNILLIGVPAKPVSL